LKTCLTFGYAANFNLQNILSGDMKSMTLPRSKTITRVVLLLSAGLLAACISLASTLPGPVSTPAENTMNAAPSTILPAMMDASESFRDTGDASPVAVREAGAAPETPAAPMAAMNARVASGELATAANVDGIDAQPDRNGCMPEPLSIIMMASGLLGLIGARRFRK
jgi:hypothetical protein